jgi:hypothetical protein
MKIDSAQPKIIDNAQGLLVDFQIIGSEVNGDAASSSLLVGLGNIPPNTSAMARWQMTASLTGEFTEFSAYFSHADDLGGETTSLIEAINTHFLVRNVLVDGSGSDPVRDFLAKDNRNEDVYRVYGSDTVDNDVLYFTEASSEVSMRALAAAQYELTIPALPSPVYVKVDNPMAGDWLLKEVVRSDGKVIKPENVWISQDRATPESPWDYYLNLFDVGSSGSYTIIYGLADDLPQPPELQLVGEQRVAEGQLLNFTVSGSDPNGTVPALTSTSLPVGAGFVDNGDGNGVFSWPTSAGQAGTYQVAFRADDGDLTDSGKVAIRVYRPGDTDMDGMDDAWELANFGSLDRDGAGDFDGDGISDLDEFLAGTDPAEVLNEAPSVPEISGPLTEAISLTPELVIVNSVDPDDDLLTYNFQLFSGPGFNETTELVGGAFAVAEQATASVWTVDVSLDDNAMYWWRVQANDGQALSEWASGSFFVNTVNDPPASPQVSGPADLSEVATLTPTLEVTNSSDIDNDAITYRFMLYAEDGETLVASSGNLAGGADGVTGWPVTPALTDNTEYVWQVIATDEHGLAVESIEAAFFVNMFNEGPTAPTINAPGAGSEVPVYDLTLLVDNSTDPDRDNLRYHFEIDTVNTFDSSDLQVSSQVAEGVGQTGWPVIGLVENSRYYWRARSSDGLVDSDWTTGSFFVNQINEAPPIPSLVNPAAGAWLSDPTPLLQLGVVNDPDQDALTYEFEVYSDNALTELVDRTTTTENSWPVAVELEDNLWYYWRARAVDEHGEPSDWMTVARFFTDANGYDDTPVITLSAPSVAQAVNDDSVTVLWADSDPDSSALINLYYDNDDQGEDGLLIADGISEDTDGVGDGLVWDISALAEGTYYIYAVIDDGNSSSTSYAPGAVVVDRTAPVSGLQLGTPLIVDGDTVYITGQTSLTITATDAGPAPSGVDTISYSPDGAAQWLVYSTPFNLAGLAEGPHDVAYSATDLATNRETDKNLSVVIDNTAPETTITIGSPRAVGDDGALYVDGATEFSLSGTDSFSGVAATEYHIDSGTWLVYAPFTLTGLTEGAHTIGYRSTDQLGNIEEERTLAVVVDDTAPLTTITTGSPQAVGADGALYVGGATEFTLSATDTFSGVGTVEYRLDTGIWLAYAPFTLAGLTDGGHTIGYRSTDNLGNGEDEQTLMVVVDNTVPETAITTGDPQFVDSAGNLYVRGATEFILNATDNFSGVASSDYRLDNGTWLAYAPFTLVGLADGAHIIGYRSTDQLGNVEVERTLAVVVDNLAPTTTITIGSPRAVGADTTLYVGGTTVFTLSGIDASAGVAATEYRLDNTTWLAYAPFTLAGLADGGHTIDYRSTDNLGNVEDERILAVVVDNTEPETTITTGDPKYTGTDGALYVAGATEFSLSAIDSFSGVASTEYRIDSGSWTVYAPFTLVDWADGTHTIGYRSTDHLGNVAAEQSLAVVVDNTAPVTRSNFNNQNYQANGVTFLSKVSEVVFSAIDQLSGVNATSYRFDDEIDWHTYAGPFRLDNLSFGDHVIHFYSVDNLSNAEPVKSFAFTLIGVEVSTGILNLPRVLVWTENPDDPHGKNRPPYDRADLLALFEEALGVPDIYLGLATDKDEFESELRSGIYNMAMVINQDIPFDVGFMNEMREAVHRGMGLLVSSWGNNVHPIWQDLFGIDFSGSLPMNEAKRKLFLPESPISLEQTLVADGRMLKIALDRGELAGVVVGEDLPAVVLGEYGQGRTAFLAYNIIESALSGELSEHAALLRNSASYLLPQEAKPDAGGIALFETRIKLRGANMDVLAVETLGEGLSFLPLFDLVKEPLEYQFRFEDGGEAVYRYFVNIPDQAGEYLKETEVLLGLDGSYVPYDAFSQAFMVEPDSEGLMVQAINLLDNYGGQYPDAVAELAVIADRLAGIGGMPRTSLKECEQVIHQCGQSIQQVEKLSFDTTDLRVLLDEYLRIIAGEAALLGIE